MDTAIRSRRDRHGQRAARGRERAARARQRLDPRSARTGAGRRCCSSTPAAAPGRGSPSRAARAPLRGVAPDHPGFGGSDDLPEVEAIDDLVYHYLDVLDRLGLERVARRRRLARRLDRRRARRPFARASRTARAARRGRAADPGPHGHRPLPHDARPGRRDALPRSRRGGRGVPGGAGRRLHPRDVSRHGGAGALRLGAVPQQPQARAPAAPHHRARRSSCGPTTTASSRSSTAAVTPSASPARRCDDDRGLRPRHVLRAARGVRRRRRASS